MKNGWTQAEGIALATKVEGIAPMFGYHVALTGGLLYTVRSPEETRKDCDLLFYRIRQCENPEPDKMFEALHKIIGLSKVGGWGWCHKGKYNGKDVDMFFPEETGGKDYKPDTSFEAFEIELKP